MIDAHCHVGVDFSDKNITRIINGTTLESSRMAVEIANENENVWACVGVHPEEIKSWQTSSVQALKDLTENGRVVGIGEVGLDYRPETTDEEKEKQRNIFKEMVNLAIDTKLPIVVHNRGADHDIYEILSSNAARLNGILMHCFSRGIDFLYKVAEIGAYFSYGGFVLNEKNDRIKKAARLTPLDKLLLETDSPFGGPDVKIVAGAIAQIRSSSLEEIDMLTSQNARKLFRRMI